MTKVVVITAKNAAQVSQNAPKSSGEVCIQALLESHK